MATSDEHDNAHGSVDLRAEEVRRCPFDHYAALRERAPVFECDNLGLAVASYDKLVELSRDNDNLSRLMDPVWGRRLMGIGPEPVSERVEAKLSRVHPSVPALFTTDPPEHTRHRRLSADAFLPRRVRTMEELIRAQANALVDAFVADGEADLISQFAMNLPVAVVGGLLCVEERDAERFKRWSLDFIAGAQDFLDEEGRLRVADSIIGFQEYFLPLLEARREQPTDDMLSDLVNARLKDGTQLTIPEIMSILMQFVSAGWQTTGNFICNSMVIILRRPELQAQLTADPGRIPHVLEECLRFDPPFLWSPRKAKQPTEIEGRPVTEGEMVMFMWGAGCWDPDQFPEPDVFDPDRPNAKKHLAFGHGVHFCIGADLARLEARISIETLLTRLPGLALDVERSDLTKTDGFSHYGYRRAMVTFTPGAAAG
ncbi:MAG: cytochrome P450 [Solirubrobacteraceae bacterium]